jgi:ferredoxin
MPERIRGWNEGPSNFLSEACFPCAVSALLTSSLHCGSCYAACPLQLINPPILPNVHAASELPEEKQK